MFSLGTSSVLPSGMVIVAYAVALQRVMPSPPRITEKPAVTSSCGVYTSESVLSATRKLPGSVVMVNVGIWGVESAAASAGCGTAKTSHAKKTANNTIGIKIFLFMPLCVKSCFKQLLAHTRFCGCCARGSISHGKERPHNDVGV